MRKKNTQVKAKTPQNGVQKKEIAKTPKKQNLAKADTISKAVNKTNTPKLAGKDKNTKKGSPKKQVSPKKTLGSDDDEDEEENENEELLAEGFDEEDSEDKSEEAVEQNLSKNIADDSSDEDEDDEEEEKKLKALFIGKAAQLKNDDSDDSENDSEDEKNEEIKMEDQDSDDDEEPIEAPVAKSSKVKQEKHATTPDKKGKNKNQVIDDQNSAKDRTIFVQNLKPKTSEDEIRKHFGEFGTIETVTLLLNKKFVRAFVVFTESSAAENAEKSCNQTTFNGTRISVKLRSRDREELSKKDPTRTIVLANPSKLDTVDPEDLKKIFGKCGEIDNLHILCKNVLAFVEFKDPESVKKALKLSGTTVNNIPLEITQYAESPRSFQIYVQNLKPGVTEDELRAVFAPTCNIYNIIIKYNYAYIRFKDADSFCKSFLLNEALVRDQMIFLQPHSDKKQTLLKNKKRPFPQKDGLPKKPFKKFKKEHN